MGDELLSLKWSNHTSAIFHALTNVRDNESYSDATLACDGQFYKVHKFVLSTCSEYFQQMFKETNCKHPVIVLKDIKSDDLDLLLNYMYVGEVNVLQCKLASVINAAESLKIRGLAVPDERKSSPIKNLNFKEKRIGDNNIKCSNKRMKPYDSPRRRNSSGRHRKKSIEDYNGRSSNANKSEVKEQIEGEKLNEIVHVLSVKEEPMDHDSSPSAASDLLVNDYYPIEDNHEKSSEQLPVPHQTVPDDIDLESGGFPNISSLIANEQDTYPLPLLDHITDDVKPNLNTDSEAIISIDTSEFQSFTSTTTKKPNRSSSSRSNTIAEPKPSLAHETDTTNHDVGGDVPIDNSLVLPFDLLNFPPSSEYTCPVCGATATHRASFRAHYMVHSGEKPYACPHCTYRARQSSTLKQHVLVKHRDHTTSSVGNLSLMPGF